MIYSQLVPKFLEEMQNDFSSIEVKLNEEISHGFAGSENGNGRVYFSVSSLNEDAMATEKLAEGITEILG